jgi:cysteine desulfurase/selenocysteine lyase
VPFDPETIRRDFPILQSRLHGDQVPGGVPLVYLDNAATSQRPRQVIDAIVRFYEQDFANVHRGIHTLSERATERYEQARAAVQNFIHAESHDEVIFTRGATEAVNLVARSWGDHHLGVDDEILLTEMEHHANLVPWQQLAARCGCRLRFVPVTDEGRLDLVRFGELLSSRTRLVAVTAVSNVLGVVNPVREIVERTHAAGGLVLVDAAQSVPHMPVDVQALDCDFLAFSGHKMLGPTGIGVLYGKRRLLDEMPPFLGGGGMIRRVTLDGFQPADLPDKFEAGTPPITEAVALHAAIDYLREAGLENIHRHCRELAALARRALAEIDGVRLCGAGGDDFVGIVSFTVDRVHAHDLAQILDRHGVAVRAGHHCAMPLHSRMGLLATTRASVYLYNTVDDVMALATGVRKARDLFARRPAAVHQP